MSPDDFSALSHLCLIIENPHSFPAADRAVAQAAVELVALNLEELQAVPSEVVKGAVLAILGAHENPAGPEVSMIVAAQRARTRARLVLQGHPVKPA